MPHIARNSKEGGENVLRIAYATLDAFLKGEKPHVVEAARRSWPHSKMGMRQASGDIVACTPTAVWDKRSHDGLSHCSGDSLYILRATVL